MVAKERKYYVTKSIYLTLIWITCSEIYNNGDDNLLQYILNNKLQKQQKPYLYVDLTRQNICEAKSRQQDFLVVDADVTLMVPN